MPSTAKAAQTLALTLVLGTGLVLAVDPHVPATRCDERCLPDGTPIARGASVTLLPSGRWFVLGGEGSGAQVRIWDPGIERTISAVGRLDPPRSWHTATVLSDGTVFVFGGFGPAGEVVEGALIFDPAGDRFRAVSVDGLTPRAMHSATLLIDGRVLIVGGLSPSGEALTDGVFWNSRTSTVEPLGAQLNAGRYGQTATLLANGLVVLSGGFDAQGNPLSNGELFEPSTGQWTAFDAFEPPEDVGVPELTASMPPDGSADVVTEPVIGMRFSKPLQVESVTPATVELLGPEGPLSAHVIAAENGMLVFVTPLNSLREGVEYSVALHGLTDRTGLLLAPVGVRFSTQRESGTKPGRKGEATAALPTASARDGAEEWTPDARNLKGDWRTGRLDSQWRSMPPLRAKPGQTAVAGQVLRLDGKPLPNVRLRMGDRTTRTDAAGRFLLVVTESGWCELWIDAGPTHGTYEVGVRVVARQTNVLPFTIWLPKIDLANAVSVEMPTQNEVVLTTPKIPGLEVHIPPGTTIVDHDGQPVSRLSITPIPTDRPPFPLAPDVTVPVYFTVQPGGAYLWNANGEGARLVYPNYRREPAWMRFNFWHYDPEDKGWFIYGHGTVTENVEHVVPDPGVAVYEFTGAMVADPDEAPPEGPEPGDCDGDGDPVDLSTGLFILTNTDLFLPDVLPISLDRTYRQNDARCRAFGVGTTHPYDLFIVGPIDPWTSMEVVLPDGGRLHYDRVCAPAPCNCPNPDPDHVCNFDSAFFEHTSTPGRFYKSRIHWKNFNPYEGGWELTLRDGTVYTFPDSECVRFSHHENARPSEAGLLAIRDRFGNTIRMTREVDESCNAQGGRLLQITSPNGR